MATDVCVDSDLNCNGSKLLSSSFTRSSPNGLILFSWTASPFLDLHNGGWAMHWSGSIGNRTVLDIRSQRPALQEKASDI